MKKVLIFRFSAMGDVALVLPVVLNVLKLNPDLKITIVTREKFKTFFEGHEQIDVFVADFDKNHKGFLGLIKLFAELKSISPNYVLDLHQNIRTQVLKFFFRLTRAKVFGFDKGRSAKKKLVKNLEFRQLPHVTDRYLEVFKQAGLIPQDSKIGNLPAFFQINLDAELKIKKWLDDNFKYNKLIGMAPFAQHKGKIWPLEKYENLIRLINQDYPDTKMLVFGGGKSENQKIALLKAKLPSIENLVGKFSLKEELALIKMLDLMICGDSSNMHFATLSNIPVISIWGSTHRFAGFGALFQSEDFTIEISKDKLECRPCSVYGNKPCIRNDYACLEWISPEMVFEKVKSIF
jgi:ADP-heptose:LPS heptosyltransferase